MDAETSLCFGIHIYLGTHNNYHLSQIKRTGSYDLPKEEIKTNDNQGVEQETTV